MRKISRFFIACAALGFLAACDAPLAPQARTSASVPQSTVVQTATQFWQWPPPVTDPNEKVPVLGDKELFNANWMVVLDNSGSMDTRSCSGNEIRMVAGGKAVHAFSQKRPDDNFGLVVFTTRDPYAKVAVPLGKKTQEKIGEVVRTIRADTNTPLRPAIKIAFDELGRQSKAQRGFGQYHIVVITDGEFNEGGDPAPLVKNIVTTTPVQVHTVGFCTGTSHRLNIPGYVTYVSIENASELNRALSAVAEAVDEDYTAIKT